MARTSNVGKGHKCFKPATYFSKKKNNFSPQDSHSFNLKGKKKAKPKKTLSQDYKCKSQNMIKHKHTKQWPLFPRAIV